MSKKYIYSTFDSATNSVVNVEVDKTTFDYLNESQREIERIERREHRHNLSLDSISYEGHEYSYYDTYPCEELETQNEKNEQIQQLLIGLNKLTPIQKRRLTMYYVHELTYEQIAYKENVNPKTVYESVQSALEKLKKFF